tara:strand:- start:40344 stop:40811 length:468 start_codon:yes stop_codon:yes gene_type:complete
MRNWLIKVSFQGCKRFSVNEDSATRSDENNQWSIERGVLRLNLVYGTLLLGSKSLGDATVKFEPFSVVAQGGDGIDACGPACGQDCCQGGDDHAESQYQRQQIAVSLFPDETLPTGIFTTILTTVPPELTDLLTCFVGYMVGQWISPRGDIPRVV